MCVCVSEKCRRVERGKNYLPQLKPHTREADVHTEATGIPKKWWVEGDLRQAGPSVYSLRRRDVQLLLRTTNEEREREAERERDY